MKTPLQCPGKGKIEAREQGEAPSAQDLAKLTHVSSGKQRYWVIAIHTITIGGVIEE